MRVRAAAVLAVAVLLATAACGRAAPEPESSVPSGLPTADSSDLDAATLADLDERLEAAGSTCFVVLRDGKVVHEQYWNGGAAEQPRPTWSVTKSFTSVLLGIAADQGRLSLDDEVSRYVPQWQGTDSADVTIRDLMSNTSGRQWSFATDYQQMALNAVDKTEYAIGLGQAAEPGTQWIYNNAAIQVLSAVLRAATGQEPGDYAQKVLFDPLGMKDTGWDADRSGHSMTYAGVSSTCRDLAAFGQMALDRGSFDGTQVVSRDFMLEATDRSSSDLNAAYGLLWWVNRPGAILGATQAVSPGQQQARAADDTGERLAPRVPEDAFWALGLGSQVISVVPSEKLVAVRLGNAPRGSTALQPDRFTGDLLEALAKG